jgi:hypothetical protein
MGAVTLRSVVLKAFGRANRFSTLKEAILIMLCTYLSQWMGRGGNLADTYQGLKILIVALASAAPFLPLGTDHAVRRIT